MLMAFRNAKAWVWPRWIGYWVAELWDEAQDADAPIARWTTECPGRTGPVDLESTLELLRAKGWRVYWAGLGGDS